MVGLVWKVWFGRFGLVGMVWFGRIALIGLIWDIWFERLGWRGLVCQKILAKQKFGGKFRWKNLVQKIIGSR